MEEERAVSKVMAERTEDPLESWHEGVGGIRKERKGFPGDCRGNEKIEARSETTEKGCEVVSRWDLSPK